MYLSNIKLWNFRKFGCEGDFDLAAPCLDLNFKKGLNVLIGENDSGKSAIIDAIKLVLKTHSYEWLRVTPDDFYSDKDRFRIELRFDDLADNEAKNFTEWLGWTGKGAEAKPYLRLIYDVKRSLGDNRIFPSDVRAGVDDDGYQLTAEAMEYLKATYLKPLRDAQNELTPKKNSRLSQILQGHEAFKGPEESHHLISLFQEFNLSIEKYFEGKDSKDRELPDQKGKDLKGTIDKYIHDFYDKSKSSQFGVVEGKLKNILEKLELTLKDEVNPGLGTLNRLFMSSELLHLSKTGWDGIRLGLIEELEAHLHPQAQMQIIESLQEQEDIQLILTTHSPNIGSKLKLENLIICSDNNAFPMGRDYTMLEETDYTFLERFMDVTKANLFFARGVILVEGWAEELVLPVLANKLKRVGITDKNLTEAGVSIVNLGNTAFLRYSGIFQRKAAPELKIPVAIVSDLDLRPAEYIDTDDFKGKLGKHIDKKRAEAIGIFDEEQAKEAFLKKLKVITAFDQAQEKQSKEAKYKGQCVEAFISLNWTLEYCLALSDKLARPLYEAVQGAGQEMEEDGYSGKTIAESWDDFSAGKSKEKIAFDLYYDFIGSGKKISKSIIAQRIAEFLENDTVITRVELETDENISYLIEAIKYVTGQP